MTIGGVICPVVTPLTADQRLDVDALEAQVERLSAHVDAIMVLGTTGELPLLPRAVADDAVAHVARLAGDRMTVVLGIGDAGTAGALDNLRRVRPGVDYVAACTPYYFTPADSDALIRHFTVLADTATVPLLLYNIPQCTGQRVPVAVAASMAAHPNVAGIKDSSGDAGYFADLARLRSAGFAVLQGDEKLATTSLRLGADGIVSGLENVAPGTVRRLIDAVRDDDVPRITAQEQLIRQLADLISHGYWLSALKYAVSLLTGGSGTAAAPLPEVGLTDRVAIEAALDQVRAATAV
ncbi:dihydrodipicolinate synthase family protein [Jiangella alba]|uniref:4-hydroxy-tetrahydrodipicolinate synthase n=1 Tax=Jiangella alba TaxID=561176 RepID=A0A1H5PWH8_9ACTN|nr:dihydrodipicolinate synthase family protein [Jiangella alba]SEF18105.1 4-hydroxy-tetrahydrodipicolinate synthase [Jiangella alba]